MFKLQKTNTTKKILFLAIGLLTASSIRAQQFFHASPTDYSSDNFYQFKIGFEAGMNSSNTTTGKSSPIFSTSSLTGFNAGITFELPITYPVSFAPEILYAQRGYKAVTPNGNFTQRTKFIDIPLLAKLSLGPVYFYVGPQVSFLTAKQNTYDNGFVVTTIPYYNKSNSKTTYYDGVFGIGFNLNQFIDLHARYVIDLQQTAANGNGYEPGYSNQVWQIGLGLKF
jgi:hypothetical protein